MLTKIQAIAAEAGVNVVLTARAHDHVVDGAVLPCVGLPQRLG